MIIKKERRILLKTPRVKMTGNSNNVNITYKRQDNENLHSTATKNDDMHIINIIDDVGPLHEATRTNDLH